MQNPMEKTKPEHFPPLMPVNQFRIFLETQGVISPTEGSLAVARSQGRSEFEWTKIQGRVYYRRDSALYKLGTAKY
jgi:hypothetical protein